MTSIKKLKKGCGKSCDFLTEDEVIEFEEKCGNYCLCKECQAKISEHESVMKDIEKSLIADGKFTTSLNRKVCYEAGKRETLERVDKFIKELKKEIYNKHYIDGHCESITIVDADIVIDKLVTETLNK